MNNQDENQNANQGADESRRNFLRGASIGVAAGAVAVGTIAAASGTAAAQDLAIPHQGTPEDIKAPKGLGRRAMLDQRFPVAYSQAVPQGVSVLTQWFVALQEQNLKGMADVMHFPFGVFESAEAFRVDTAADLVSHAPPSLNMNPHPERFTDHDGYMQPGAYDVFEGIETLCVDPVNCAMSLVFNRFDSHGRRILRCEGIYSVTNNDGRWALQAMSTIWTPDRMVGVVYDDVIQITKRLRIDHDLSYNVSDRVIEPPALGGSRLAVSSGGSPWNLGPAGRAMDEFKVAGVKSRLTLVTAGEAAAAASNAPAATAASAPAVKTRAQELVDYADYRKLMGSTTGEEWGFVYGQIPETRVLHHTVNKAHRFSAATRFTASGEPISTNTDLGIVLYRKRQWGNAGSLAYTTPHDRANDIDVPGPLYVAPPGRGRGGRGAAGGRGQ
jgi:hypothetical protein